MSASKLNEKRLALVMPLLADMVRAGIKAAAKDDCTVLVTQGLRTWEEQDALYAKGRSKPGAKVTNARGGSSWHNFGLAVDCVPLESSGKIEWNGNHPSWQVMAKHLKAQGLEWGGEWTTFIDKPHFQYTSGLTLAQARALYANGKLRAVWDEVIARASVV